VQTGVCACVSLEVERVVETLAADGAQVALDGVVAAQMAGEQSLQWKHLAADPARPLIGSRRQHCTHTTRPCIPPGSLNRVPASAGVRAGMSPLPSGR